MLLYRLAHPSLSHVFLPSWPCRYLNFEPGAEHCAHAYVGNGGRRAGRRASKGGQKSPRGAGHFAGEATHGGRRHSVSDAKPRTAPALLRYPRGKEGGSDELINNPEAKPCHFIILVVGRPSQPAACPRGPSSHGARRKYRYGAATQSTGKKHAHQRPHQPGDAVNVPVPLRSQRPRPAPAITAAYGPANSGPYREPSRRPSCNTAARPDEATDKNQRQHVANYS